MADSKITALASIGTGADPANDPLVIVDVSDTSMAASGTPKKVTINQILGASGTATLASATITGNLAVQTNALFVNSANNRVGFGTLTPNAPVEVRYSGPQQRWDSGGAVDARVELWANSLRQGLIGWSSNSIIFGGDSARNTVMTWQDVGGVAGAAMTLNSTGLGLGVVPAAGRGALQLSSGINFPATQVASSDPNTLDDYEEGTWTGTLTGSTTNPTTPVTATGRYTKIGRQVSIQIHFSNVDTTGASGQIKVTGSPFSSNSSVGSTGAIMMSSIGSFTGSPTAFIGTSTTEIELYASSSAGAIGFVNHNAGASRSLWINLTYTV